MKFVGASVSYATLARENLFSVFSFEGDTSRGYEESSGSHGGGGAWLGEGQVSQLPHALGTHCGGQRLGSVVSHLREVVPS